MSEAVPTWRDRSRSADDRARALLAELTLEEKVAQLGSTWPGAEEAEGDVAPMQEKHRRAASFEQAIEHGIGQLTRPYGTAPITPADGAVRLAGLQRAVVAASRLGIPAVAHEECLTGVTAWQATIYPTPLAWGATFDPVLVREMALAIGTDLRRLGIHQGLSPVLDVVRDYRWGRVEETIGEDPNLVATIGAAYVDGLETAGIVATPKHFAGYSASRGARNHAPVSIGRRELRDVILPPFERALQRARSVMNSYTDMDGVPAAADASLLTGILRDKWGFEGTVVSDYWAIPFLATTHRVVADEEAAGPVSLAAGIDVELPHTLSFGGLADRVRRGELDEALIDRAVLRVLRQKAQIGLLDPDWSPEIADPAALDLDSEANRLLARKVAEESIVLLQNDGILPLDPTAPRRIAVLGPCADDARCLFGCYAFTNHVLPHHPDLDLGVVAPTYLEAIRATFPGAEIVTAHGASLFTDDRTNIADAASLAAGADLAIVIVGDRSGLFGAGTSGEGCDVPDLTLPGSQDALADAVLDTGTPTVLVVSSGRPYALGGLAPRARAVVQTFLPGEEGATALAELLAGVVEPSGRLPVQVPVGPGAQPGTYLAPPLALRSEGVSNIDPTPLFAFGHGLTYTTFTRELVHTAGSSSTEGERTVAVAVTNVGARKGTDVVQLYVSRDVASVVQPTRRLLAFARVDLEPNERRVVRFTIPAGALAFTDVAYRTTVEPGPVDLVLASSARDTGITVPGELTGQHVEIVAPRPFAIADVSEHETLSNPVT